MNPLKLRICLLDYVLELDKPGTSGLSDIVWDMASRLVDKGHEVHIVAPYNRDGIPDNRVQLHTFAIPPAGYRWIVGHLWISKRMADKAVRLDADIYHAPEYVSTAVLTYLHPQLSKKTVVTVPGNIFHRIATSNPYPPLYTLVLKWAAKQSARSGMRVIAISKEMKHWWEKTGSAPERTPWIPLGVDTSRFYPVHEARSQLGIPKHKVLLLYVGRFSREKGLLNLLDALAIIKAQFDPSNLRVTLIGKGRLEQELRERIAQKDLGDIVVLRPWVAQEELKAWYSAASALLLPSESEPLGRVMFEAMACGTPVVAAASEGPKDHIQSGSNGYLFPLKDVKVMSEVLLDIITKPEQLSAMGQAAFAYAQQHLTWMTIVERIVKEVYTPVSAELLAPKNKEKYSRLASKAQRGDGT